MKTLSLSALLLGTALTLASCGGGTGGTGASSPAVSIGVMEKGSVIVNGVRFEDTTANITIDDTLKTAANLQSGMVVKVRGRINNDRLTGTAERVEVENEVRGMVQTHNSTAVPPSFTVVNQTVLVDDLTVFANFSSPTPTPSAAVGQLVDDSSLVEVHGLRDATGNIRASRVEVLNANPLGDELRGTVKLGTLIGTTFTLQNGATDVAVNFSGATITPAGATLTELALVEVHGAFSGATFNATLVDVEDLEDTQFEHAAGEGFEIEGHVSGCGANNLCTSFFVGTQAVQTNANTRFENGAAADLADGARVEAEGHDFTGTTLIAEKIKFKRTRVILTGAVTLVNGTVNGTIPSGFGNTGTITVLGKTVQVTTITEIKTNTDNSITTADRVEVRGFVDSSGAIVAERVDDNPGGGNKDIVQARVEQENEGLQTLVLIGTITANLTTTLDANIEGTDDLPLPGGKVAFFNAVVPASTTPPGTLVKVKGTFTAGTLTVEEAELEN